VSPALPAAGGGHWVEVAPERLAGWLDRFADRHGPLTWTRSPDTVVATAADGATADCRVPFPPLAPTGPTAASLVTHALRPRRVGVLLVRLGGYAAGVFDGAALTASKVGSRPVHGRSAAGGWSQQRFARRRDGQARVALAAAADAAAGVLLPAAAELTALIVGGERRAAAQVLDDPRLAPLRPLVTEPFLTVPDPRRRVLDEAPAQFRAVRIRVLEPDTPASA
jgi:hypothetical protein